MAKLVIFRLPVSEVSGSDTFEVEYKPLAGDGYTSPVGLYAFNASIAGDASGGTLRVQVVYDRTYTAVPYTFVAQADGSSLGTATELPFRFFHRTSKVWNPQFDELALESKLEGPARFSVAHNPPPFLADSTPLQEQGGPDYPQSAVAVANAENLTLDFRGQIMLFRRDVRDKVPYPTIMAALRDRHP